MYHRRMLRRVRLATIAALCSALLGLSACAKGEPAPALQAAPASAPQAGDPAAASGPAPVSGPPAAASEASAAADPSGPAAPATRGGADVVADASMAAAVAALARSEARMTIKVSIANESGFRLDPLTKMHALAISASGASTSEPDVPAAAISTPLSPIPSRTAKSWPMRASPRRSPAPRSSPRMRRASGGAVASATATERCSAATAPAVKRSRSS